MSDDPAVPLSNEFPAIPSDCRILYFGRDREAFGFLSHFHPAPIELDGERWPTVEHYYQAQKSENPTYRAAIRNAVSPGIAKRLAAPPDAPRRISQQSWFRRNAERPRLDWSEVKLDIMRRGDWGRFAQHSEPRRPAIGHRLGDADRGFAVRAVLGARQGWGRVELGWARSDGSQRSAPGGIRRIPIMTAGCFNNVRAATLAMNGLIA